MTVFLACNQIDNKNIENLLPVKVFEMNSSLYLLGLRPAPDKVQDYTLMMKRGCSMTLGEFLT